MFCRLVFPYRPSTGALHLLIDGTGIKAEGEGEWFAKKHGLSKPRQWRKVHLGTEKDQVLIRGIRSPTKADTLEIRAIEVTGSRVGDAPMLPELLDQIPTDQPIDKVSADGAHDTRGCHAAIHFPAVHGYMHERGGARHLRRHPCIQERAAMAGKHPRRAGPEQILRATRRLGRTIWRRWSGYHRRSRVETKMHCFKLPGARVMAVRRAARTGGAFAVNAATRVGKTWRFAELQIRAAILNRFTALGTPQTQRVG